MNCVILYIVYKTPTEFWWENLKERDHLEDLGVDGRIKLKMYEGCSESNAPLFFSGTIYSECMKFTHLITGCFLYTCYFST